MADTVWLYLVVSSDAQEETLEAQRRWGYEEAARIGTVVDPNGIFEGVASGKLGARTILLDLIAKLSALPKAQRPSRVLMVRLDRAGRMPLDAISAINDIRKLGVMIRTRKDGDLTWNRMVDLVGPMFDLMRAGFDNEVRSDMSRSGHKRRRDEGKLIPAKPPYGVTRNERGYAIPDPQCAPVVREVFERWNAGESPAGILQWLRETAPARKAKITKKNPDGVLKMNWSLSHLYKLVHLRTYRGIVVEEEVWDRAQQRKRPESRPGPGGRIYPFSGLLCHCGERLHARINNTASRYIRKDGSLVIYPRARHLVYYVCQSMKHPDRPRFRNFREDKIEEQWVKILARLHLAEGPFSLKERTINRAPGTEMLQKRIDALAAKRERIHSAFEEGAYDAKTMQSRLTVVQQEERRLEAELAAARAREEEIKQRRIARERTAELIKYAAKLYTKSTRERKAELNRAIFAAYGAPTIHDDYEIVVPDIATPRRRGDARAS